MIPDAWRRGEVAVIGLARTGTAVSRWLVSHGARVYASDLVDSEAVRRAAADLKGRGIDVEVGRHDLARLTRAVTVIVSPGVPPDAPPLVAVREAGVPVRAELDVAAAALRDSKLIVVTGTNGKSTTTALVAQLLAAGGIRSEAAGNIGRPLVEVAAEPEPPAWIAVEASSFQLHDAPNLAPAVGVVTNLSPDHLDRYRSVDEYYADKRLLFRNATAESVWVLNGDDQAVTQLADRVPGTRRHWRVTGAADGWYDAADRQLMLAAAPLLSRDELPLLGTHNVENALAAALAAQVAGVAPDRIADGLRRFLPLAHRLEPVGEIAGILWINDSKATNVASARVALQAMERPFIVLLGGRHKGEPYDSLVPVLRDRCRGVIAFGEAAPLIASDLTGSVKVVRVDGLDDAVQAARGLAHRGEAVLLAPACASFDQFTSYEARGARFRDLVAGA